MNIAQARRCGMEPIVYSCHQPVMKISNHSFTTHMTAACIYAGLAFSAIITDYIVRLILCAPFGIMNVCHDVV